MTRAQVIFGRVLEVQQRPSAVTRPERGEVTLDPQLVDAIVAHTVRQCGTRSVFSAQMDEALYGNIVRFALVKLLTNPFCMVVKLFSQRLMSDILHSSSVSMLGLKMSFDVTLDPDRYIAACAAYIHHTVQY